MHRKHIMFRVDDYARYRGMVQLFFPLSPIADIYKHVNTHTERNNKNTIFQYVNKALILKHRP